MLESNVLLLFRGVQIISILFIAIQYYFFRNMMAATGVIMHNIGEDLLFLSCTAYFSGFYAISQCFSGYLLDRFKGKIFALSCFCLSLCFYLLNTLPMKYMPYVFGLIGINSSLISISIIFFLSLVISTKNIGTVSSFTKFSSVMIANFLFAYLPINNILYLKKIYKCFYINSLVIGFIVLVFTLLIFREYRIKEKMNYKYDDKKAIGGEICHTEFLLFALMGSLAVVPFYCFSTGWFSCFYTKFKIYNTFMTSAFSISILALPILYEKLKIGLSKIFLCIFGLQFVALCASIFLLNKITCVFLAIIIGIANGTHLLQYIWISKQKPKNIGFMLGLLNFIIMFGGATLLTYGMCFLRLRYGISLGIKCLLLLNIFAIFCNILIHKKLSDDS